MKRKLHWETVYQQKQPNEVSWYQVHPEYSLNLIRATGVARDRPIIDVGGGASHLVDQLLATGYQDITVLDIAAAALVNAHSRLGSRAAQVTWLESDVTTFEPPKQYALWHDRAVFHFLTDAPDRQRYLAILQHALPPGGHAIIATFSPDGPKQCSNLPVERYDATKLQATVGDAFKLLETRSEAHVTPANKTQHFLYFWLQRNTEVDLPTIMGE